MSILYLYRLLTVQFFGETESPEEVKLTVTDKRYRPPNYKKKPGNGAELAPRGDDRSW